MRSVGLWHLLGAGTLAFATACGSSQPAAPASAGDAGGTAMDAGQTTDAGNDAALPDAGVDAGQPVGALTTGTRIVPRASTLEGLTDDGYVIFSEPVASGGRVAKVVALDGSGEALIATGTSTDKTLRIAVSGKVAFVWTDRQNRSAALTVWSKATGAVAIGSGIRPGRAAATSDGASIAYMSDVATTTANLVVGPIAGGSRQVIAAINASDANCWRDANWAFSGATSQRFVGFFCPSAGAAFSVVSTAPDGSHAVTLTTTAKSARFGANVVVTLDTSGALRTSAPDGSASVTLATNAAQSVLSRDETTVFFRAKDGSIGFSPATAASPRAVAPAGTAIALGGVSSDARRVMFAGSTTSADAGSGTQPTDVRVASVDADGGAPSVVVAGATSCVDCLADPFTPDSTYALALDPLDTTSALSGSGPLRMLSLSGGASVTFGAHVWDAISLHRGSGASSRFLLVEIAQAAQLETGFAYDLSTRGLTAGEQATYVAKVAENAAIDNARTMLAYSIPGAGDLGGVWVAPLP